MGFHDPHRAKANQEVTHFGFAVVDTAGSVAGGRSTSLGLSLVWLHSIRSRGRFADCPRYSFANRAALTGC